MRSVAGYALGNEISERSWQRSDRTPPKVEAIGVLANRLVAG